MAADDLATQGAGASAAIVLTSFSRNIPASTQKGYKYFKRNYFVYEWHRFIVSPIQKSSIITRSTITLYTVQYNTIQYNNERGKNIGQNFSSPKTPQVLTDVLGELCGENSLWPYDV